MQVLLIINPVAGKQKILTFREQVRQVFLDAGWEITELETPSQGGLSQVLTPALAGKDIVVCAGGDGTLHETLGILLQLGIELPVGYIPAGSTNDFASSLGLNKNPVLAAKQIVDGTPHRLDAGSFEDRTFIYVASFGAFTQTSVTTTQNLKNSLGHLAYVLEGMKELPRLKSYPVRITADTEIFEGTYLFGSVSNATTIGGVLHLDEDLVDFSDGVFELMLVKTPVNLMEFSRIVLSLMTGNFDPELITLAHVKNLRIECQEEMDWSLDGEYAKGGLQAEMQVLQKAITIIF